MAYKVIILYRLYMPSYVLGTFTEYPYKNQPTKILGYNLSSISNSIIGGFILSQWNRQTYKSINSLGVAAKIHIISTNKQSSQF